MSLTSHLRSPTSPVRMFIDRELPNLSMLARSVESEFRLSPLLCPYGSNHPFMRVGTAIDYRLRFYFSRQSAQSSTIEMGKWFLATKQVDVSIIDDELSRFLNATPPVQVELTDADEEHLCRLCWFVALTEAVGRDWNDTSNDFAFLHSVRRFGIKRMLSSVEPAVVHDLLNMSRLFYRSNRKLIEGFKQADVGGTLAGSNDVEGADFDFSLDGRLFDVKTHKVVRHDRVHEALLQLVGYVLLDYDDRYNIRSICLYFTRHGISREFKLAEELNCTDDHLTKLRDDFRLYLSRPAP